MNKTTINDFQIVPIKLTNESKKKPKHELFFGDTKFPNIVVFAKKHSGKTMMLYNLIKDHKILDSNTKIFIFSSSCKKDQTYIDMINYLRSKGNKVECHTSIFESSTVGKRKKTINKLKEVMDKLQKEIPKKTKGKKGKKESSDKIIEEIHNKKRTPTMKFLFSKMIGHKPPEDADEEGSVQLTSKKVHKGSGGKITPEVIFIFDDLSKELRDPEVGKLLRTNRHFKSTCFYIGHSPMDLNKGGRTQTDVLITFKGFQPTYVEHMRLFCNSPCDEKKFWKIYKDATKEPYNFLWVNANTHEMRQNFNQRIEYEDKEDIDENEDEDENEEINL